MLLPSRFAAAALLHGTLAAVCDPHEIANVLGAAGIRALIADGAQSPFIFSFGVPSCVPATEWEPGGAVIGVDEVRTLLNEDRLGFLGEVMNFPGVLSGDPELSMKIALAKEAGIPIDGHAPGLSGAALRQYINAGITTDHECSGAEEALEKISAGMRIQIREGSAARNFEALLPVLMQAPEHCMFCSDDLHCDALFAGHINLLAARALWAGVPLKTILHAASVLPITHYRLPLGLLRAGDSADFIILDYPLTEVRVREAWMRGKCVAKNGVYLGELSPVQAINSFREITISESDLAVVLPSDQTAQCTARVIELTDGQLLTGASEAKLRVCDGQVLADPERDILKLTVVGRYPREETLPPALAFVHGFGLRDGAIASSVAHDAHNIIAVGSSDAAIARAINLIAENHGGIAACGGGREHILPLPFGGLMTLLDCASAAAELQTLEAFARNELKSALTTPFMTLSFLALLVIPKLKLGERGLFDGEAFEFVSCVQ
jgi:adenine deaminase